MGGWEVETKEESRGRIEGRVYVCALQRLARLLVVWVNGLAGPPPFPACGG